MPIGPNYPTPETLMKIAGDFGIELSAGDAGVYRSIISRTIQSYRELDRMVEPKLPVEYARDAGYQPAPQDNPLNAWLWRCEIKGAPDGILKGENIGLKDVVCVAGLPLTNGTRVLDG